MSARKPSGKRAPRCATTARTRRRVVASGRNLVAEKILEAAREAGVPVREVAVLAQALETLELDTEIPPELYRAVDEALAWAYRLTGRATAAR